MRRPDKSQSRVPVTALIAWPTFYSQVKRQVAKQTAAPAETRTPNMHRPKTNRSSRVRMEGWRQWLTRPERKPCLAKREKNSLDSDRPSHGRRLHSQHPSMMETKGYFATQITKVNSSFS